MRELDDLVSASLVVVEAVYLTLLDIREALLCTYE